MIAFLSTSLAETDATGDERRIPTIRSAKAGVPYASDNLVRGVNSFLQKGVLRSRAFSRRGSIRGQGLGGEGRVGSNTAASASTIRAMCCFRRSNSTWQDQHAWR